MDGEISELLESKEYIRLPIIKKRADARFHLRRSLPRIKVLLTRAIFVQFPIC